MNQNRFDFLVLHLWAFQWPWIASLPAPPSENAPLTAIFAHLAAFPTPHALRAFLFPNLHFGGSLLMGGGLALSSSARKTQLQGIHWVTGNDWRYTFSTRREWNGEEWIIAGHGFPRKSTVITIHLFVIHPSWMKQTFDVGFFRVYLPDEGRSKKNSCCLKGPLREIKDPIPTPFWLWQVVMPLKSGPSPER